MLPSLSEALSNSLIEAMACGCTVVASRIGGNPELVTDGANGMLFAPGDVAGLAGCLQRLIVNEQQRRQLAGAALESVAERFSHPHAVRQVEDLYTRLLAGT
ncbi:MAG: glycosyltransferase family 4 protein [bacterium]|nr:glycosyltransferase family 4 protein [bacterium]